MNTEDQDSREALMPRRRGRRLILVAGLLASAVLAYWYGAHGREAKEGNEINAREIARVVAALDSFRQRNGRYPRSLSQLYPEHLAPLPELHLQSRLLYKTTGPGDGCWLAVFPHYVPSIIFPSDFANEYDCAGRTWSIVDIEEARAGPDEEWSALLRRSADEGRR